MGGSAGIAAEASETPSVGRRIAPSRERGAAAAGEHARAAPLGSPGMSGHAGSTPTGAFRSLAVRNYRLYFLGQLASLCGTWMQSVALAWLVLDLTDSGTQVGLVTAAQLAPVLVLGGAAGVLIDRFDRRRLVIGAEVLLLLQATVLTVLVVTGPIELWMIYVLAVVQGIGDAVEQPGRQALLSELVPDHDLPNAVSLNTALFTLSRVVGPALAAVFISTAGVGLCFTINAVSFLGIIAALVAIRPADLQHRPRVERARSVARGHRLRRPIAVGAGALRLGGHPGPVLPERERGAAPAGQGHLRRWARASSARWRR